MTYDYGNARLRAMKARLLTPDQMNALAAARSLPAFITGLTRTPYRHAAEAAAARGAGITAITELLRIHAIDTIGRIRQFYEGAAKTRVMRLLEQFDVHNVTTILRGLAQNIAPDEIATALIPVGELSHAALNTMMQAYNVHAALDTLSSLGYSIAHPLLDLRAQRPGAAVWEMELALARWYLAPDRWPQDGTAMQHKRDTDADLLNLMTMLRFAHTPDERQRLHDTLGLELADLLLPAGRLSESRLIRVGSASSIEKAVPLLETTAYFRPIDEGHRAYLLSHQLSAIERELRRFRLQRARQAYVRDPLGIGVPVGYLELKANEIGKVRAVAWGIHLVLGATEIQRRLETI